MNGEAEEDDEEVVRVEERMEDMERSSLIKKCNVGDEERCRWGGRLNEGSGSLLIEEGYGLWTGFHVEGRARDGDGSIIIRVTDGWEVDGRGRRNGKGYGMHA
jgi:hypothetical protein